MPLGSETSPLEISKSWIAEYEKRIEIDLKGGDLEMPAEEDRRKNPRLRLEKGKGIWLHTGRSNVPILDLSCEGLAFYSETEKFPGDKIYLDLADGLSAEVNVLECFPEEYDATFMELRYRVRAKFGPSVDGYKIYVLARDMYTQDAEQKAVPPPRRVSPK